MDDKAANMFAMVTGASEDIARRYLAFTDQNVEQAVELFFNSPDLASSAGDAQARPPPIPSSTRPSDPAKQHGAGDGDSDDDMDYEPSGEDEQLNRDIAAATEDDEAMARRLQNEMYEGGVPGGGPQEDEVRAPMQRTTETLMGGGYDDDAMEHLQRMRAQRAAQREGTIHKP